MLSYEEYEARLVPLMREKLFPLVRLSPSLKAGRVSYARVVARTHQEYDEMVAAVHAIMRYRFHHGPEYPRDLLLAWLEEMADLAYYAAQALYLNYQRTAWQVVRWLHNWGRYEAPSATGVTLTVEQSIALAEAKYRTRFVANGFRKDREAEYAAIARVSGL